MPSFVPGMKEVLEWIAGIAIAESCKLCEELAFTNEKDIREACEWAAKTAQKCYEETHSRLKRFRRHSVGNQRRHQEYYNSRYLPGQADTVYGGYGGGYGGYNGYQDDYAIQYGYEQPYMNDYYGGGYGMPMAQHYGMGNGMGGGMGGGVGSMDGMMPHMNMGMGMGGMGSMGMGGMGMGMPQSSSMYMPYHYPY